MAAFQRCLYGPTVEFGLLRIDHGDALAVDPFRPVAVGDFSRQDLTFFGPAIHAEKEPTPEFDQFPLRADALEGGQVEIAVDLAGAGNVHRIDRAAGPARGLLDGCNQRIGATQPVARAADQHIDRSFIEVLDQLPVGIRLARPEFPVHPLDGVV